VLLYDGQCAFCGRWSRRLARWDRQGRIRQIPFQERDNMPGLPQLSEVELGRALQVVLPDGQVVAGARGLIALLPWLPAGRPLGWLARAPGLAWLADRVYAAVARRRHRVGAGAVECE
jgi:predicted DCC family thiol-disulfide oxidoreductase YuxK